MGLSPSTPTCARQPRRATCAASCTQAPCAQVGRSSGVGTGTSVETYVVGGNGDDSGSSQPRRPGGLGTGGIGRYFLHVLAMPIVSASASYAQACGSHKEATGELCSNLGGERRRDGTSRPPPPSGLEDDMGRQICAWDSLSSQQGSTFTMPNHRQVLIHILGGGISMPISIFVQRVVSGSGPWKEYPTPHLLSLEHVAEVTMAMVHRRIVKETAARKAGSTSEEKCATPFSGRQRDSLDSPLTANAKDVNRALYYQEGTFEDRIRQKLVVKEGQTLLFAIDVARREGVLSSMLHLVMSRGQSWEGTDRESAIKYPPRSETSPLRTMGCTCRRTPVPTPGDGHRSGRSCLQRRALSIERIFDVFFKAGKPSTRSWLHKRTHGLRSSDIPKRQARQPACLGARARRDNRGIHDPSRLVNGQSRAPRADVTRVFVKRFAGWCAWLAGVLDVVAFACRSNEAVAVAAALAAKQSETPFVRRSAHYQLCKVFDAALNRRSKQAIFQDTIGAEEMEMATQLGAEASRTLAATPARSGSRRRLRLLTHISSLYSGLHIFRHGICTA
ncbi:hypothetical protein BJY52DRAFT_1227885 [Lactarius psammicola]|nr:hypothetical protein BJY52DRAFT_1227885 [Lactarius psammicola]